MDVPYELTCFTTMEKKQKSQEIDLRGCAIVCEVSHLATFDRWEGKGCSWDLYETWEEGEDSRGRQD